jgi:hypothetical protein
MSTHDFFTRYAELSLGPNPAALAALYAPTFIVAGPQGSQAFANDARFLEWLREVAAFNREHGMNALLVSGLQEMSLSPRHALVTVTWGARFEKTGQSVIEFDISYLLEKDAEQWRILSYVSRSDQDEAMKELGLT